MKTKILFLTLIAIPLFLTAQENRIKFGIQGGLYSAANYDKIQPGENISFELSYCLTERFFLASHANYGWNRYYDDELSNYPDASVNSDGTNANISTIHIGLLAGYSLPIKKWLKLFGEVGISTYTESKNYPYQTIDNPYGYGFAQSTITDLAFPVKLGTDFLLGNNFEISLVGGFYIEPDYPIVGMHFGPQISYKF